MYICTMIAVITISLHNSALQNLPPLMGPAIHGEVGTLRGLAALPKSLRA